MSATDRPPGWGRGPQPHPGPHPPTRRPARRWLLPGLVLGALAGTLAGLMLLPGPSTKPVVLAVAVTEYDTDWPPNPFARTDAEGVCRPFTGNTAHAFQSQAKESVRKELRDAVKAAGPRGRVVVYLSALGTVVADTPYLLPADAKPDDPAGWLTLDDLLAPFENSPPPTLLILDVRPAVAPRAVLPTGDVNERLDAELAARTRDGKLPITVLHANTPQGGPVVLRPLKQTAFGLAVARAVGGAADGWAGGTADGVVSVGEVTAYVRAVTHAATSANAAFGGEVQTPTTHGTGPDFPLLPVLTPVAPPPDPTALPAEEPYPDALKDAWTEADKAARGGLPRRAPRVVQPYLTAAALAERRWLAGGGGDAVAQTLKPKPVEFRDEPAKRPPASLARAGRGATPDKHGKPAEPVFRGAVTAVRNPNPEKKDEFTQALAKVREDKSDPPLPFDVVAAHLFDAAIRLENPTQDQFRQLLKAAEAHPSLETRPAPIAELAALDLIAGVPPDQYAKWVRDAPEAVAALLAATRAAERATAFDGRFLPWVKADLADADAARRLAMIALCDPATETKVLKRAPQELKDAAEKYETAKDRLDKLKDAQFEVEEARAVIDDLGDFGPPVVGTNPENWASTIREMADVLIELSDLLRRPLADLAAFPGGDLTKLTKLTNQLWKARTAAADKITPAAADQDLERYLRWPRWTLKERQDLHDRLRKNSAATTARVLTVWPGQPNPPPPAVGPRGAGGAAPAESVQALRVAAALLVLRQHGREKAGEATDLKGEVENLASKPGAAAFSDLSRKVLADRRRATADETGRTTDLDTHRTAEREFATWLATHRYGKDADAIRPYVRPGPASPVTRWLEVAAAYRK